MSKPARRSHAERTALTRAKIMNAVVDCIADVGFGRTTAAEIARRSGMTWGAVQHHFGSKKGILIAVLEDSFDRFAQKLSDIETQGIPLEKRVDQFIDRAWEHFGSAHYRSMFEILLSYSGPDGPEPESLWQSEMLHAWDRIWKNLFSETELDRRGTIRLQYYTISVLSGLASTQMLGSPRLRSLGPEIQLLKDTLVRELATPDAKES
ncbi:MAG: TetR/AcrR family transcriptional regulator [Deltaproteobacteria bacterium]|nr:TetR/AcrR family transcriptional regulator [Deltaproteobacteria bacterium]